MGVCEEKVNNDFGGSLLRGGPNTLQHWEEYEDERENYERDVVTAVSVLEMQLMVEHTVHFTRCTQLARSLAWKGLHTRSMELNVKSVSSSTITVNNTTDRVLHMRQIKKIEVQMSTFVNKVLN